MPALFIRLSMCFMHTATAFALCGVEIAPRSVVYGHHSVYQDGTVDVFTDTAFLDSGTADFGNIFNLDPGVIYPDIAKISRLVDSIDNGDDNSELLSRWSVDRFQGD
ncbi:hypothetical protein CYMTET_13247 [Cymbomonas tetramitiformis]|uniref:Uncharacterized protein n=1 Tax=Cymbomonas tetramitiformis TaxID=36881 RepID=A0AAE0GIJ1_9CHLO|nr:hypothetical protein CYMTET_13247 [Cymbomonas tetramitiformis]